MSYSFDQAEAAAPPTDIKSQAAAAIPGTVRMISGCEDHQTSADVGGAVFALPVDVNGACGACTNALMSVVMENPNISWVDVLEQMREKLLQRGFDQIPQLSTSDQLDVVNESFSCVNPGGSYSSGRKRALMIGICYRGQQGELSGCHNDVDLVKGYIQQQGFDDIRQMTDDGEHEEPTRANILAGFDWLVEGAMAGDSLFFHYSGHGGQETDISGDEASGLDDTLIPVDYLRHGMIIDDIVFEKLVMVLPKGVHLMAIMDCCHSGTVLDLPYIMEGREMTGGSSGHDLVFSQEGMLLKPNNKFNFRKLVRIAGEAYAKSDSRQNAIVAGDKLESVLAKTGAGTGIANLTAYVTNTEAGGEAQKTVTLAFCLAIFCCIAVMLTSSIYSIMFMSGKGKK